MSDWQEGPDAPNKAYFFALNEGDDPVEEFGEELGSLDIEWSARHSFEFNRRPLSSEEAVQAIVKYVSG